MAKDLTQFALDALRPGLTRREVPDGKQRGLYFIMQPSGTMSWAFRYRFAGATKKLTRAPIPPLTFLRPAPRRRRRRRRWLIASTRHQRKRQLS